MYCFCLICVTQQTQQLILWKIQIIKLTKQGNRDPTLAYKYFTLAFFVASSSASMSLQNNDLKMTLQMSRHQLLHVITGIWFDRAAVQ